MDAFLKLGAERQRQLCEAAGDTMGLDAASVEKDFWVCWTLKELFALKNSGPHLTFKGGTSLSKGWKLIDRFSEDILKKSSMLWVNLKMNSMESTKRNDILRLSQCPTTRGYRNHGWPCTNHSGSWVRQNLYFGRTIVRLIQIKGVAPETLFVVTFTDKAARELKTRISNRLGELEIKSRP